MGRIARRLDGNARQVERAALFRSQIKRFDGFGNPLAEIGENVHFWAFVGRFDVTLT